MSAKGPRGLGQLGSRLKKWLTLSEAAKYLSLVFQQEVCEADVLRFSLDGHLTLSVRFVHGADAKRYHPVDPARVAEIFDFFERRKADVAKAKAAGVEPPPIEPAPQRPQPRESERVFSLDDGVFDLPLIGGERIDVEHRYQRLTGGPAVDLIDMDGTFVDTVDGVRLLLQERLDTKDTTFGQDYDSADNFYPPSGLGNGAVFVVRMESLHRFEADLNDAEEVATDVDVRPLGTKERSYLLAIIGGLAHCAKLDLSQPTKAAGVIANATEMLGASLTARGIENHLKLVPAALEKHAK